MSSPNAGDYVYTIFVALPDENPHFENEMRNFLTKFIFRGENCAKISQTNNSPAPVTEPIENEEH